MAYGPTVEHTTLVRAANASIDGTSWLSPVMIGMSAAAAPSWDRTVSSFDWFTDNIATVLAMLTTRMNIGWLTRLTGRFFFWSAGAFAKPPFVTVLQVEALGIKQGGEKTMTIRLSHEDAYLFTAIPVVACIMQYLKNAHEPGFYFQSHFLEPETLLHVLSNLGIQTRPIENS